MAAHRVGEAGQIEDVATHDRHVGMRRKASCRQRITGEVVVDGDAVLRDQTGCQRRADEPSATRDEHVGVAEVGAMEIVDSHRAPAPRVIISRSVVAPTHLLPSTRTVAPPRSVLCNGWYCEWS